MKVQHVKVPVTDVPSSARWYASLLDLDLVREFVEAGRLRGVALRDPASGVLIALREREACASRPVLAGFDPFALRVAARQDLHALVDRCRERGVQHSDVQDRSDHEAVCDVVDPDGTVLRFLWSTGADEAVFDGLEFDGPGPPSHYRTPRLRLRE